MPRVIVLGTGTGVGKTYVSRALVEALAMNEPSAAVGGLKPIESGVAPGSPTDAAALAGASRAPVLPPTRALFEYALPVAPYLAARREGRAVDVPKIAAWVNAWEAANAASRSVWSVIETAGGVFSPISETLTNFELAQALSPAIWLLVAPDALGVLHDVRASFEALAARGRPADELVLSSARPVDASSGTNAAVLRELGVAEPIAVLRSGSTDLQELVWALVKRVRQGAQA